MSSPTEMQFLGTPHASASAADVDDWAVVANDSKGPAVATTCNGTASVEPPNAVPSGAGIINEAWMASLFPTKPHDKLAGWLRVLTENEFETTSEIAALDTESWSAIALPLAIKSAIRAASTDMQVSTSPTELTASDLSRSTSTGPTTQARPIEQLDVVVMDISKSMKSRSALDETREDADSRAKCVHKTREDVSKMLFHTMVDKTLHFEVDHAVGLLAFGEKVTPVMIDGEQLTTEYERFHDELGRLDANERQTALYDSIATAAEMLAKFQSASLIDANVRKRIFVLTDGADNASGKAPWEVARLLQDQHVVLDAIPLAGPNSTLHAMCMATGGLCFQCPDQEQAIALFEREATLRLCCREQQLDQPSLINNPADFTTLQGTAAKAAPVASVKTAIPKKVFAPALTTTEAAVKAKSVVTSDKGCAALRRVMKEYGELCSQPMANWKVFISAEDSCEWKAVFTGPASSPHYAGGTWLLSISFPPNYPFKGPSIKFITPLYHCNVSPDGMICLDILQGSWSPADSIRKALACIEDLVENPDAENPLDAYKGSLYRDNRDGYHAAAAAHTAANAMAPYEDLAAQYKLPLRDDVASTQTSVETVTTTTTTTTVTSKT